MNTLEITNIERSPFYDDIDMLCIDGVLLGGLLTDYIGEDYDPTYLIPTISSEISSEWDREYIWSLLDDEKDRDLYLPILMCDEVDLSCLMHLLFVHIKIEKDCVSWLKFGVIDFDKTRNLSFIEIMEPLTADKIKWIKDDEVYKFDKREYNRIINHYRHKNEERRIIEEIKDWLL